MSLKDALRSSKLLGGIWSGIATFISKVHWPRTQAVINRGMYYYLTEEDHDHLRELLAKDYYLIMTWNKCHLSSHMIALVSWLGTGAKARWSHVLMNVEGDLEGHLGFKLIEATGVGVHYSSFMQVFDCDSVALLKPKGVDATAWTAALDTARTSVGKPYDTLFDILDDKAVSCVELVYDALKTLPGGLAAFPNLTKLIEGAHGELTPQMLYDCGDLEVVFEVHR
jgi:hypothetical protein